LKEINIKSFAAVLTTGDSTENLRPTLYDLLAYRALGFFENDEKDITQPAFSNEVAPWLLLTLFVLKPLSTILCLGSGVPSGLFTPSLALGAFVRRRVGSCLVLDLARRAAWSLRGPGRRSSAGSNDPRTRLRCRLGDGTDGSRPVVRPLLLAVVTATVVARTLDPRSIYDARLTKRQIENLQQERKPPSM